jgi:hypothetical protein
MIIISGDFNGPELKDSHIWNAIGLAMKSMERLRAPHYQGTLGTIPHVNAVFFVAGSLGAPDFDVIRIGPYSKKDKCLQVDIAVTEAEANSKHLRDIIVLGLQGANANAFHYFDEKGMEFPLRDAEALVKQVGEELSEFA